MEDEITKELSKILDKGLIQKIYEDGLSSPAKETGEIITDVIKTARLFTAPFQLAAAYQIVSEVGFTAQLGKFLKKGECLLLLKLQDLSLKSCVTGKMGCR